MDICDHVTTLRPAKNHSILRPQKWLCTVCGTTESVYACLSCAYVGCGRFNEEHSLQHYKDTKHPIAIEVNRKHVYCYKCDEYVLNDNPSGDIQQLRKALSAIETQSFQEVSPRERPLLRSLSIHEESSEANQVEDKLQTAETCRRKFLLRKAFWGWKIFLEENGDSTRRPKRRRLSESSSEHVQISAPVKRPTITPGVTGLRNLGNTCYMNSILQVLSHLHLFRSYFLQLLPESNFSPWSSPFSRRATAFTGRNLMRQTTVELFQHLSEPDSQDKRCKRDCNGRKTRDKRGQQSKTGLSGGGTEAVVTGTETEPQTDKSLTVYGFNMVGKGNAVSQFFWFLSTSSLCLELHALFRVLWSGKWAQVSPHAFLQAVWTTMPTFKGYSQQDAQEFLCELLDKVQEELRGVEQMDTDSSKDIVTSIFQGELASQVTCQSCGHQSRTVEPFMDLSLEFPDRYQVNGPNWSKPKGPCHLTEMLTKFTDVEDLDGEIYVCEQCNGKQRRKSQRPVKLTSAKKQLMISQLPPVLRLHLKRFRWSGRYHREKICSHVNFTDNLNMEQYCEDSSSGSTTLYKLSGVVIHHGQGFGCGHYTAFTWNHIAANQRPLQNAVVTSAFLNADGMRSSVGKLTSQT